MFRLVTEKYDLSLFTTPLLPCLQQNQLFLLNLKLSSVDLIQQNNTSLIKPILSFIRDINLNQTTKLKWSIKNNVSRVRRQPPTQLYVGTGTYKIKPFRLHCSWLQPGIALWDHSAYKIRWNTQQFCIPS